MIIRRKHIARVWILFLSIPMFLSSSGVFRGTSFDVDSFALPISLFLGVGLISLFPSIGLSLTNRALFGVWVVFLTWTLLYIGGALKTGNIDPRMYSIYSLPMLVGFCFGSLFARVYKENIREAVLLIEGMVYMAALFCLVHLISSFYTYGIWAAFAIRGEDSIFGLFSIYQKLVYYPTVMALLFLMALGGARSSYSRSPIFLYICALVILLDVFLVGSREGVLLVFFSILYWVIRSSVYIKFPFLVFFLAFILVGIYLSEEVGDAVFLTKWKSLIESGDFSAGRIGAIKEVFENSKEDISIFGGTYFSMSLGDMRTPHNQYLELFLRGGLVGVGMFMLLILPAVRNAVVGVFVSHVEPLYKTFSMILILLMVVSFNVNTPVRAPYPALFFYFVAGFLLMCGAQRSRRF